MSGFGIDRPCQSADTHPAGLRGIDATGWGGGEYVARRMDLHCVNAGSAGCGTGDAETISAQGHHPDLRCTGGRESVFCEVRFRTGADQSGQHAGYAGTCGVAHEVMECSGGCVEGREATRRWPGAFRPSFSGSPADHTAVPTGTRA